MSTPIYTSDLLLRHIYKMKIADVPGQQEEEIERAYVKYVESKA
jgi:hypothetical protein